MGEVGWVFDATQCRVEPTERMESKQHFFRIGDGGLASKLPEPASRSSHCRSCPTRLLRLSHPLQSRQPEVVSAVHERLITLAKARRILSNTGLIHHDVAHGATRLQIPGVIEARRGSRHVAVPSQALIQYILVHFAFDRQAKRGPPEHRAVLEHRIPARYFDIL